ncbi:MAG: class I SAM-dependent rRNA methyltransferase [Nitrospirota bacterium]
MKLKKKEDRRIRRGHPWAFSNEFEEIPKGLVPGEMVRVVDYAGRIVGTGYVNPHTLIAVRFLTRGEEPFTVSLIKKRIEDAKALRERFYPARSRPTGSWRAVYSESDLLPGLIVDKYGDWLSVQVLTQGMEGLLPEVLDALREVYNPAGIVLRNDAKLRALEGLPLEKKIAYGEYGGRTEIEFNGLKMRVDLIEGQKTGFFLDQVDNYSLLEKISGGADVLDLFCHTGAWGISALMSGAKGAAFVDSSATALAMARENAELNGLSGKAEFIREDALTALKRFSDEGKKFDVVIADPPAFIKSRLKIAEGMRGYRDLNSKCMRLVRQGGFFISCSCSHHLSRENFLEMLRAAASSVGQPEAGRHEAGRPARIIETRSQSRDHPILLAAPEAEYLKCALMQVG